MPILMERLKIVLEYGKADAWPACYHLYNLGLGVGEGFFYIQNS